MKDLFDDDGLFEEIKAEGFLPTMRICVTKFSPVLSKKKCSACDRKIDVCRMKIRHKIHKCYRLPVSILPLNIGFPILQEGLEI